MTDFSPLQPAQPPPAQAQRTPLMVAVGGLSGSGKTTLAQALAKHMPGAVVLDSDVLMKRLHGVDPLMPLPAAHYTPETITKLIQYAHQTAAAHLQAGDSVIVTGTFLDNESRKRQQQLAESHGAKFVGLYLDVPVSKLFQRVASRRDNPSDATVATLRRQISQGHSQPGHKAGWHIVRADKGLPKTTAQALQIIRQGHKHRRMGHNARKGGF